MNITFTPSELRAFVKRVQEESSTENIEAIVERRVNKMLASLKQELERNVFPVPRTVRDIGMEGGRIAELVENKIPEDITTKLIEEFMKK